MIRTVLALALLAPLTAHAQSSTASFLVVHGIPGRDVAPKLDPLLPVDVLIDGKICLLQNFTFGSIAGPYDVPAGTYTVAVSLANPIAPCSNAAVISGSVALNGGEFGAVVAALSSSGTPTADVFTVNVNRVGSGEQRLVAFHAADAEAATVTAKSTGGGASETARLMVKPGREQGASVPARSGFALTAAVDSARIGPFDLTAGDQAVILGFAVGSAKSGSLTLLTKVIPSAF